MPVLLPGEQTSTRIEPAKSLYAAIPEITRRPGVIDAAIWVGYAWADEPRNHAAVVVTGDDQAAVKAARGEPGRLLLGGAHAIRLRRADLAVRRRPWIAR